MTANSLRLREILFSEWIWRLSPQSQAVSLTFDDGPDPRTTPKLIECLERLGLETTFFFIGERCRANPSLVHGARDTNQQIAIHGFRHVSHRWLGTKRQLSSLLLTENTLRNAGVIPVRLFRPPYGSFNHCTLRAMRACGYTGVLWSVMVSDWLNQGTDELRRKIRIGLHPGAIIVLHDRYPTIGNVLGVLPWLRDEVLGRGWKFCTLQHLAAVSHRPVD